MDNQTVPTPGLIVVLGSPNAETGELYSVAQERADLALAEFARRPGWKLLLTGGYGAHFNTTAQPHAAYVKRYLLNHGLPAEAFVEFAESANTLQDASLAKPIVLKYHAPEIVIITSDYHLARAQYIFEREFAGAGVRLQFLASRTDEQAYPFDLEAQKNHERQSLARLKAQAGKLG